MLGVSTREVSVVKNLKILIMSQEHLHLLEVSLDDIVKDHENDHFKIKGVRSHSKKDFIKQYFCMRVRKI